MLVSLGGPWASLEKVLQAEGAADAETLRQKQRDGGGTGRMAEPVRRGQGADGSAHAPGQEG